MKYDKLLVKMTLKWKQTYDDITLEIKETQKWKQIYDDVMREFKFFIPLLIKMVQLNPYYDIENEIMKQNK